MSESGEKKRQKPQDSFWKIHPDNLKTQVEEYKTLKITSSYRGETVLIFLVLIILSSILVFSSGPVIGIFNLLINAVIYLPLLFLIYKGGRNWAIITLAILWSIDKIIQLFSIASITDLSSSGISFMIFRLFIWAWTIAALLKTLKVENEVLKSKS